MIYYIANISASAIKIGYTKPDRKAVKFCAQGRLSSLQCGSPDTLYLLAVENGDQAEEGNKQNEFKHLHIRGEWFHAAKELLDHIEGLEYVEPEIIALLRVNNTEKQERILRHTLAKRIHITQTEAEEIIKTAQKKAQERTTEIVNFACKEGEKIVRGARERAYLAHREAKELEKIVSAERERARGQAAEIVEEAQERVDSINKEADEIISFAREEADGIIRTARKRAGEIVRSTQKDAEKLSTPGKYRFDHQCKHCGMPDDTVCERANGLSWCDSCWDKVLFAEIAAKARELGYGKVIRY